jgi:hypothetical protein
MSESVDSACSAGRRELLPYGSTHIYRINSEALSHTHYGVVVLYEQIDWATP